jgi:hypothetical protein
LRRKLRKTKTKTSEKFDFFKNFLIFFLKKIFHPPGDEKYSPGGAKYSPKGAECTY